jgi:hypothetical protein
MAASATDDIHTQLAVLLGRQTVHIRKTDEDPPRISIIDVIAAVTGKDKNHAAEDLRRLAARHPDINANCVNVKFRDSRGRHGQKDTLVTNARWHSGAHYAHDRFPSSASTAPSCRTSREIPRRGHVHN